jgi:hypothetical protein
VSGGDIHYPGDRPLLTPRLLLAHDPLGRHGLLAAPRDDRNLVRQQAGAGEAATVVARRLLEEARVGIANRRHTVAGDATLVKQAERAAAGPRFPRSADRSAAWSCASRAPPSAPPPTSAPAPGE